MDKPETREERNSKKAAKSKLSKTMVSECSPEDGREDDGWNCSVCTFKNNSEAFKCLMCDVRKGTSTRKPRINPELVAQQVARQQQHLLQKISSQNHTKTPPKSRGDRDKEIKDGKDFRDFSEESVDSIASRDSSRSHEQRDSSDRGLKDVKIKPNSNSLDGNSSQNSNCLSSSTSGKNALANSKSRKKSLDVSPHSAGPSHQFNNNNNSNKKVKKDSETNGSKCGEKNGVSKSSKNLSDKYDCSSEAITVNNVTVLIKEFLKETKSSPSSPISKSSTPSETKQSKSVNSVTLLKQKKEAH